MNVDQHLRPAHSKPLSYTATDMGPHTEGLYFTWRLAIVLWENRIIPSRLRQAHLASPVFQQGFIVKGTILTTKYLAQGNIDKIINDINVLSWPS